MLIYIYILFIYSTYIIIYELELNHLSAIRQSNLVESLPIPNSFSKWSIQRRFVYLAAWQAFTLARKRHPCARPFVTKPSPQFHLTPKFSGKPFSEKPSVVQQLPHQSVEARQLNDFNRVAQTINTTTKTTTSTSSSQPEVVQPPPWSSLSR